MADLAKNVQDKEGLHEALYFHGQLYIPPIELCTLPYLAAVLEKKKLVFQRFEINSIDLEQKYQRVLTIEKMLAIANRSPNVARYLPDDAATHC